MSSSAGGAERLTTAGSSNLFHWHSQIQKRTSVHSLREYVWCYGERLDNRFYWSTESKTQHLQWIQGYFWTCLAHGMYQDSKELTEGIKSKAKPWFKAGKAIHQQLFTRNTAHSTVISLTKEQTHTSSLKTFWINCLLVKCSEVPWENNVMYQRTELLVNLKWTGANPCIICPVLTSNSGLIFQTLPSSGIQPSMLPATPQEAISKTTYQFLSGTRLHVVGIWICVLQGVTTLLGSGRKREKRRTRVSDLEVSTVTFV